MAKIHYKAIEINDTIAFVPCSDSDRSISYRSWWGNGRLPFILDQLIKTHWMLQWLDIYKQFNEALIEVSKVSLGDWKSTSVLVRYIKDDNQSPFTKRVRQ